MVVSKTKAFEDLEKTRHVYNASPGKVVKFIAAIRKSFSVKSDF